MTALYGTSFENLEDEERDPVSKKPTGIQDQVATDERGRRRFHGAFTGGFSAGYFNTVGSKHGWAPTEFRSTRDERPDNGRQRAEDFMDDEDLGEFGISSRRIRQTKEFSTGSTLAWERGTTSTQSTVEGIFAKDLQVAIKPVSDSIGIRMLREMGWRQGRAVGLTTIREAKKHRHLNDVDREQITKVAPHWVAAAEDEEVIHMDPLEGIKGLGYSGELKGSDLLNQKYGQGATMLKGKKGKGITGQAFGVGAFEDEDESVYTSFDLSQYDFALGPAAAEKRDNAPDSSFIPAKSVLSSRKFYGAPKIPPTFKGIHTTKTLDASVLPSRMKTVVEGLNSEQRALFLGENRQTAEGGIRIKKKSRWDIKGEEKEDDRYSREEEDRRREREESRHAEHAKRIEYPQDENKQRRFREYLNYVRRGLAMPPPADISRWEWEKEEIEFESKLLADERALLPDVRARTKPLAKSALALPILDMMRSKFIGETNTPHATSTRDEDRMLAVKSEMFGDKTRVKFEWHPAYGLAKLFNVPNPYPGSSIHGLAHLQNKGKKREENVLSTIGLPSTAAEFAMNAGMIDDKRKDDEREERRKERDREEREERRSDTKRERDRYDKDEKKRREEEDEKDKENKGDEEEEEERAPDNLLAAIFGMESSDESEDEDDNKDNGKNPIVLPSTSNPIEKPKQKGDEKEEIIRIMDMEDEFGPAPPPGLNQTEGLTGFSVLRFNDEVMKKMKKRKRKINDRDDEREKDEKEKKKKSKKSKKEKKSSKKKHKKEKKESKSRRKSITVSSDDSSSDSSVQALD